MSVIKLHGELKLLADAWGCSIAGVVERSAMEANVQYQEILFPETE